MRQQTHLFRRKGFKNFYFRMRVPHDIQYVYDKKEVKRSLKTADLREAKRRVQVMAVKQQQAFDEIRKKLAGSPKFVLDGSEASIQAVCARWQHEVLAGDEAFRIECPSSDDLEEFRENRTTAQPLLRDALATGHVERVEPVLRLFLHLLNIQLDCSEDEYRRFLYRFAETLTDTNEQQIQRNTGAVVQTPPEPVSNLTLEDLFADWKRLYRGDRQKTIDKVESILREFQDVVGRKPAAAYDKVDVIAYRDYLLDVRKWAPGTAKTKITLLSAVFGVAVADGKLPTNPAAMIRVPTSKARPRRLPLEISELQMIFSSPLYTEGFRMKGGRGEAAVWLPLLSLFSGNREEELGQLRVWDVCCRNGIWYLNILETDEDDEANTKVKNSSSWRKLPLHPKVIEAGFLRYVGRLKEAGHVRLFPKLTPDKYGTFTTSWSKWFHRYLRDKLGITSKLKVFHSTRHNFRDACREAGLDEEIADRLMGHKGNGATGRGYGKGFSLERLKEAMDKITYPGLEIPIIEPEDNS